MRQDKKSFRNNILTSCFEDTILMYYLGFCISLSNLCIVYRNNYLYLDSSFKASLDIQKEAYL